MNLDYLDFEQPIAELEEKIEELRRVGTGKSINIGEEVSRLEEKSKTLTKQIFSNLNAQQIVQLARHPLRPYTLDYIERIFTHFDELHGDRHFSKGSALIGGMARLDGKPVMIIGHQKGRTTKEKVDRNFGMATPEGFRKALRLMKLAEKFGLPVITFIGEGCSGGALAIGVGDRTLMLQYSYYSVISPEGCASILWKSAEKANEASEALGLTAPRLLELGLIDEVIKEPLGGAHRNVDEMATALKARINSHLSKLEQVSKDDLLEQRYQYWLQKGR